MFVQPPIIHADKHANPKMAIMLIGNKNDLVRREVSYEEVHFFEFSIIIVRIFKRAQFHFLLLSIFIIFICQYIVMFSKI